MRRDLSLVDDSQPLFNFYANHAGCGAGGLSTQLACLRNASVSALAQAQDAASYTLSVVVFCSRMFDMLLSNGSYNAFHPVLDGKIFYQYPTEAILSGNHAKVPLIIGSVAVQ